MGFAKAAILNGFAVAVRLLCLLGINKVLAITVGPSGYLLVGQLQNVLQIASVIGSFAINTGVTKYTSEYDNDLLKQQALWKTSVNLSVIGGISSSVIFWVAAEEFANWIFDDGALSIVFRWVAIGVPFFILNNMLLSIVNGKRDINNYVAAHVWTSISSVIVTCFLVYRYGVLGSLIGLATYQILAVLVNGYLLTKRSWFRVEHLIGRIDRSIIRELFGFTVMASVTALVIPITHIAIRNYLTEIFTSSDAGYWEAMWRLSSAYLLIFSSSLAVYYVPQLARLHTYSDIYREVKRGYVFIFPAACVVCLFIYLFRIDLISNLFSVEFLKIVDLLPWQLVGDVLRVASWILSFIMLAKAMVALYVSTEILNSILFYGLTVFLCDYLGLQGVAVAHAVSCFVYFLVMVVFVRKHLKKEYNK
ncbi:oligosaccharide flippase family protein [Litorivicinus lipolyticus]|uniref:Oligosaccharide flippase family protein n=1 Tax=Litorivicinus lipolyticus TaxID=418701 RepID=A0A5Q2QC02_9GAMM|nr:O-antigen translocase [Litorivicinus lipolyticus]QGG80634.1 oligosaccharide flippase family protein [Litorivicinus lipolyticus]